MQVQDILFNEHHSYYKRYLDKLSPEQSLIDGFQTGRAEVLQFFSTIPDDKLLYRYAENKWSVKEVLQHMIDTERIFSYRAFRIGRGDVTPLANFDQNIYVLPSGADEKSRADLLEEFDATRQCSIALLKSLTDKNLTNIGISSSHPMSARAAAFTIIGHDIWHMDILKERYL
ncbi:MAG: DinB family protein [Bacteroidota bacterium]